MLVALRKESGDRNMTCLPPGTVSRKSLSARRAWIEMSAVLISARLAVASLSARRAWIEIMRQHTGPGPRLVALRKESVDRNLGDDGFRNAALGRSPQGERG